MRSPLLAESVERLINMHKTPQQYEKEYLDELQLLDRERAKLALERLRIEESYIYADSNLFMLLALTSSLCLFAYALTLL